MSGFVAQRQHLMTRLRDAERSHAPRSHIRRDLIDVTTKQIQLECRSYWTPGRFIACGTLAVASAVYIIAILHLSGVWK